MTYSTQLTANGHFDGYAIGLQGGISYTVFFPLTDPLLFSYLNFFIMCFKAVSISALLASSGSTGLVNSLDTPLL